MSEEEDSNPTSEVQARSSEVPGSTTKKKKKKKSKVPKNDEGDDNFIADFDGSANRKKSKKKGSTKSQSERTENSSTVDNESDMSTKKKKKKKKTPQIDSDMNLDNDAEYVEDFNEQSNNYMHSRNHHEEDQSLRYSGSTMDSSMPSSKMYNDRGRNGRPPPMHMETHNENGFIEYDDGDYMSEIGNMDPVDAYNQDYDMSEDDEEEPRFKYSTADLDDGDCRNTRCCLIAAGLFFILIAILVSVFMSKMMNKDRRRLFTSIRSLRSALS